MYDKEVTSLYTLKWILSSGIRIISYIYSQEALGRLKHCGILQGYD